MEVLDGLGIVSEQLIDVAEIPEVDALAALVANFSSAVYGLLEVLDGLGIVSEQLIDVSKISNRFGFPGAVLKPPKQRKRFVQALLGLVIIRLLPLNRPQLQQPLPLENLQVYLFGLLKGLLAGHPLRHRDRHQAQQPRGLGLPAIGLAPATRSAGVVRVGLAQEGLGLSDGFGELAVLVDAQLGCDVFGLL